MPWTLHLLVRTDCRGTTPEQLRRFPGVPGVPGLLNGTNVRGSDKPRTFRMHLDGPPRPPNRCSGPKAEKRRHHRLAIGFVALSHNAKACVLLFTGLIIRRATQAAHHQDHRNHPLHEVLYVRTWQMDTTHPLTRTRREMADASATPRDCRRLLKGSRAKTGAGAPRRTLCLMGALRELTAVIGRRQPRIQYSGCTDRSDNGSREQHPRRRFHLSRACRRHRNAVGEGAQRDVVGYRCVAAASDIAVDLKSRLHPRITERCSSVGLVNVVHRLHVARYRASGFAKTHPFHSGGRCWSIQP